MLWWTGRDAAEDPSSQEGHPDHRGPRGGSSASEPHLAQRFLWALSHVQLIQMAEAPSCRPDEVQSRQLRYPPQKTRRGGAHSATDPLTDCPLSRSVRGDPQGCEHVRRYAIEPSENQRPHGKDTYKVA